MSNIFQGIIIGGSPSTGSSLLRQILNRHTEIVCAPETHIWCKELLFENWGEYKMQLLRKSVFGLASKGFFHFIGIEKSEIPNYNDAVVKSMLKASPDFYSFFRLFMMEFFNLKKGQLFGEKTPANALNFREILETSDNILCVHTSRNPYDTIASLVARGKTPLEATAFYLYNCASAMRLCRDPRFITIKYEKLVNDPQAELKVLMDTLSLDFEDGMIEAESKKTNTVTKIESWNYDETGKIGTASVGRFQKLQEDVQNEIIFYVWHLHLIDELHFEFNNIEALNEELGYETIVSHTEIEDSHDVALKRHRRKNNHFLTASTVSKKYPLCLR